MFAIIKTGGKQYKVSAGDKIKIEKLEAFEGDSVVFDEVLLVAEDEVVDSAPRQARGKKDSSQIALTSLGQANSTDLEQDASLQQARSIIKIGQPFIEGAKVEGKVLKQAKDKKVIIFKYKAKKRYKVKRGHRQMFSEVEIVDVRL